ncbi:hypothetical protein K9O30_08090 [Clostridium bowmanii]|uniref:hypothetical protein n=1 Tax=Clostridium bowmanii TaxID=132925 RepID=UPI001C0D6BD6|nr:hypothetical protein [Clostridium bowmanii]MBU3188910.1 hypothetical protein [Clostridium bowmanii]MCA1073684.1 hypothetical protein [Clostridium bowmanii]
MLNKINSTDITTEKIKSICNRDYTNFIENNVIQLSSTVEPEPNDLLDAYKFLIPISTEGFNNEVAII